MYFVVNLPKPPELLSRLIVMCGNPHDGEGRGEHVLAAMKALSPNLREELVELWDAVIPKLLAYLSGECPGHCAQIITDNKNTVNVEILAVHLIWQFWRLSTKSPNYQYFGAHTQRH